MEDQIRVPLRWDEAVGIAEGYSEASPHLSLPAKARFHHPSGGTVLVEYVDGLAVRALHARSSLEIVEIEVATY